MISDILIFVFMCLQLNYELWIQLLQETLKAEHEVILNLMFQLINFSELSQNNHYQMHLFLERQLSVYPPQSRQPAGVSMIQMPNWSNQLNIIRAYSTQLSTPKHIGCQSSNCSYTVKNIY